MNARLLAASLAILPLASSSGAQDAPKRPRWTIPYTVDASSSPLDMTDFSAILAIKRAAKAWSPCATLDYAGTAPRLPLAKGSAQGPQGPQVFFSYEPSPGSVAAWTTRDILPSGQVVGWSIGLYSLYAQDPRMLFNSATHEFGHALGLPHSDDPSSVMNPVASGLGKGPSASDLALCSKILDAWDPVQARRLGAHPSP